MFVIFRLVTKKLITRVLFRYNNLQPQWPHLLRVSSENDIDGVTRQSILDDITKKKGEVRFGSRLVFSDCREESRGTMSFVCDEAVLRFDSSSQTMTTFKNPTCFFHVPSSFSEKIMEILWYICLILRNSR